MTYKGSCLAKDASREYVFERAKLLLGSVRFKMCKHLYLASYEGNDLELAKDMGVMPQRIHGVDYNEYAIRECEKLHSDCNLILGKAEDVEGSFGFIFHDSCGQLCPKTLRTLRKQLVKIKDGGVLAFTGMTGRESGQVLNSIVNNRLIFESSNLTVSRKARARVAIPRAMFVYEHLCDTVNLHLDSVTYYRNEVSLPYFTAVMQVAKNKEHSTLNEHFYPEEYLEIS